MKKWKMQATKDMYLSYASFLLTFDEDTHVGLNQSLRYLLDV